MTEEVQQESPASLDDVYRKFDVDKMASDFAQTSQPAPQQAPQPTVYQPAEPVVPDPVTDSEGFRKYASQDYQNRVALQKTLQSVDQKFTAYEQERTRAKVEADVKEAADILCADLNVEPEVAEALLDGRARKDPKFQALWSMRDKKPEAWKAAVKAFSKEQEGKFQLRADPQLVENQRAMKTAQQQMATGARPESKSDALGKLPMNELDRELDKIKGIL
jgi:hypothetical protein